MLRFKLSVKHWISIFLSLLFLFRTKKKDSNKIFHFQLYTLFSYTVHYFPVQKRNTSNIHFNEKMELQVSTKCKKILEIHQKNQSNWLAQMHFHVWNYYTYKFNAGVLKSKQKKRNQYPGKIDASQLPNFIQQLSNQFVQITINNMIFNEAYFHMIQYIKHICFFFVGSSFAI